MQYSCIVVLLFYFRDRYKSVEEHNRSMDSVDQCPNLVSRVPTLSKTSSSPPPLSKALFFSFLSSNVLMIITDIHQLLDLYIYIRSGGFRPRIHTHTIYIQTLIIYKHTVARGHRLHTSQIYRPIQPIECIDRYIYIENELLILVLFIVIRRFGVFPSAVDTMATCPVTWFRRIIRPPLYIYSSILPHPQQWWRNPSKRRRRCDKRARTRTHIYTRTPLMTIEKNINIGQSGAWPIGPLLQYSERQWWLLRVFSLSAFIYFHAISVGLDCNSVSLVFPDVATNNYVHNTGY